MTPTEFLSITPGAGRTVESGITRRAMLMASPAVLAIASAPAWAHSMEAGTLSTLIDAHKTAYAAYNTACGLTQEAQLKLRDQRVIGVAVVSFPDGSEAERREVGAFSLDSIQHSIEDRHAELRRIHCGSWSKRMAPDYIAQLEAELDASQARAFASLAAAIDEQARRELDAGLPALEQATHDAGEREQQARLDLLLYRPKNAAEAREKDEYIGSSVPFTDSWNSDDAFVTALTNRLGEVA